MAPAPDNDDFYVGYLRMPRRLAIAVAALVVTLFGLIAIDLYLITQMQQAAGPGRWAETDQTFEGVLTRDPYPTLWVTENGKPVAHLLVADSKRSADTVLDAAAAGPMTITGKLVAREDVAGIRMIEMAAGASKASAASPIADPGLVSIGDVSLKGEIVDSKCWLGVMRPGEGRVHKGCATVCILGGIPPVLVTRDGNGGMTAYVITDSEGKAITPNAIQDVVGDPVGIAGRVERKGDMLFLRADLDTLKRL
jgi:hypothetical protein